MQTDKTKTQPNSNQQSASTQPNPNRKARLTALAAQFKAGIKQAYQTAASWTARNKGFLLWAAVGLGLVLVYAALFTYSWRWSPDFRAVTKVLGREMASLPANLRPTVMRIRVDVLRQIIKESPSNLGASDVVMVEELPAEEIPARPVTNGRETMAA